MHTAEVTRARPGQSQARDGSGCTGPGAWCAGFRVLDGLPYCLDLCLRR